MFDNNNTGASYSFNAGLSSQSDPEGLSQKDRAIVDDIRANAKQTQQAKQDKQAGSKKDTFNNNVGKKINNGLLSKKFARLKEQQTKAVENPYANNGEYKYLIGKSPAELMYMVEQELSATYDHSEEERLVHMATSTNDASNNPYGVHNMREARKTEDKKRAEAFADMHRESRKAELLKQLKELG